MAGKLIYLGVLAAPTAKGRRAVALALSGAVELYHLVHAGFKTDDDAVVAWLLEAGINPEEAASAIPAPNLIDEILIPEIGSATLVVNHADMDIEAVALLVAGLGKRANTAIISGIDLTGPITEMVNGAAGRRAYALQARYEAALDAARTSPAVHILDGLIDNRGRLISLSVNGPFARQDWTLDADDDGIFAMMGLVALEPLATFQIANTRAAAAIAMLADKIGIEKRLAA